VSFYVGKNMAYRLCAPNQVFAPIQMNLVPSRGNGTSSILYMKNLYAMSQSYIKS
jgi:hypothetical protein